MTQENKNTLTETERIAGDFYRVKYRDKEDDDFETYAQWGGITVGWFLPGHSRAFADKHFFFIAENSIQQENEELKGHVSFLQGERCEKLFQSQTTPTSETEGEPDYRVITDYPDNIFGLNQTIPMKWNESFREWEYSDCSRNILASYFDKYPHIFKNFNL